MTIKIENQKISFVFLASLREETAGKDDPGSRGRRTEKSAA